MWVKIFLFIIVFSCSMPLGYTNCSNNTEISMLVDTPIDKPKTKEKKQKKQKNTLQKKPKIKEKKQLKRPALVFWLIFTIFTIAVVIASAFLIGMAIIPWSIALYLMLGADVAAITTLLFILFVDVPDFPDVMAFVATMYAWAVLNFILGLAFLIWGLVVSWIFGWMIGLILLGIFVIFVAVNLIYMAVAAAQDKKLEKENELNAEPETE